MHFYYGVMIDEFIIEARRYADARGIKLATLGTYAVSDKTLFARLENGGDCRVKTINRVRAYMAQNPIPAGQPANVEGQGGTTAHVAALVSTSGAGPEEGAGRPPHADAVAGASVIHPSEDAA